MQKSLPLIRILTFLLLFLVVVLLMPLLALATFNHPSPTDDYCFANTVQHYGFWQAQQFYYDGWTGRYFHNFIVHAQPLVIDWYGGYKIYPMLFLLLLAVSFYQLANQWLGAAGEPIEKIGLGAGLVIGFIGTLASIPEYLYWYTGLGSYGLSSALYLFLLATFIAHQRRGFGWQPGYLLLESILVTAIIGSSEMTMVLVLSTIGMIALGDLLLRRRLAIPVWILVVVAAISCYYLFKAPGNAIRLGGNPNSRNIPLTLLSSVKFAIPYAVQHFFLTPWIPLSLLYVPLAWKLTGSRTLPAYLRMHPILGVLHTGATVLALISLHFYGVGIPPIPRLINIVNLTFWLGWLYNLTLLVRMVRNRVRLESSLPYAQPVSMVLLLWIAVAVGVGPVVPLAYGDWLSGRAAAYDRAMQQRYEQLTQSNGSISRLEPLAYYPKSLFLEDLHTNPEYLWNRCWADYFHKKTITLTKEPPLPGN